MFAVYGGFEFNGNFCYPSLTKEHSYYCAPIHGDIQRDERGRPMVTLIGYGGGGFLMISAVWRIDDASLAELRREIARRDDGFQSADIRLEPAPVAVKGCRLLLGNGERFTVVAAHSNTSGVPPYSALFNMSLNEDQFKRVSDGMSGTPGLIALDYDVALNQSVEVTAHLISQSPDLADWIEARVPDGGMGMRATLEEAIDLQLAAVRINAPEGIPGTIVTDLYEAVLDEAVKTVPTLLRTAMSYSDMKLLVAVKRVHNLAIPFGRPADLADLVGQRIDSHGESSRTNRPPTTNPTGERVWRRESGKGQARAVTVRLGDGLDAAPIAWVQVRNGRNSVAMKAPHFPPITLPSARSASEMEITVAYHDGLPRYKSTLSDDGETDIVLGASDLGLACISIDARALAAEGVRSAEIRIRYAPPHSRREQRLVLQLGPGKWVSQYWVVTFGEGVTHRLEYGWSADRADGARIHETGVRAESPNIVLSLKKIGKEHVAN